METSWQRTVRCVWLVAVAAMGGMAACEANPRPVVPARTLTTHERQLNVLVLGDWGTGGRSQRAVAEGMRRYAASWTGPPIDAVILTGDNFYTELKSVEDARWAALFEEMYDPEALPAPFYPVLGNHDYESDKAEVQLAYSRERPASRWDFPARWYRLDLPPDRPIATVLMLDTNIGDLGEARWEEQLGWLREELARPRETAWLIVVGHHPLFSGGIHGGHEELRETVGPMLIEAGVDFYLAGHDHTLQHVEVPGWPMSFVVSAGGGAGLRGLHTRDLGPWLASMYGFVHMRLGERSADVIFLDRHGRPVHSFSRKARGAEAQGRGREDRRSESLIISPISLSLGMCSRRTTRAAVIGTASSAPAMPQSHAQKMRAARTTEGGRRSASPTRIGSSRLPMSVSMAIRPTVKATAGQTPSSMKASRVGGMPEMNAPTLGM